MGSSYVDQLSQLYESIRTDQAMPKTVQKAALRLVEKLQKMLWSYSA